LQCKGRPAGRQIVTTFSCLSVPFICLQTHSKVCEKWLLTLSDIVRIIQSNTPFIFDTL
jgi:hypothetical protein